MQNLTSEKKFDLHENESLGRSYFYMNGLVRRLILTQRQKATWKWPTAFSSGSKYFS